MTSSQPALAVAKPQNESPSLALLVRSQQATEEPSGSVRGPVLAGLIIVLGLLGGSTAWALLAPLNSAVIAHRPSVLNHVDKVLILQNGRTAFLGPRAEAFAGFARLVAAPTLSAG